MSKKIIWALVMLALTVIVIVFNARGSVDLNLLATTQSWSKSLVFLGFTGIGVVIGLLLSK
jgi:uncharacterized integral membrane protein